MSALNNIVIFSIFVASSLMFLCDVVMSVIVSGHFKKKYYVMQVCDMLERKKNISASLYL